MYVLEQTVGKDGFEIKKPLLFEITGEENPIQPPILTLNDRPILYRLRLIKTDARTGKVITLAGASFKLKDADGNTVTQTVYYPKKQTLDTFTTDESGCVTLPEEVGWGLYSIEEIQAPEGYLIRTESLPVLVGKTGDTADQVYELGIEVPNEAVMGQIVPDYIVGYIYSALVEAYASEQNARLMAMQAAADNASAILQELGTLYNRARQAAITQEITEVIAGAKAQKKGKN